MTSADADSASTFTDSELVVGLVSPVGTPDSAVVEYLSNAMRVAGYCVEHLRISGKVIPRFSPGTDQSVPDGEGAFDRIRRLMDAGNEARRRSRSNSVLALGAAALISEKRERDEGEKQTKPRPRTCVILDSLKHPDEVSQLRDIYGHGFVLIAIHASEKRRLSELRNKEGKMSESQALKLIDWDRDERKKDGEELRYGQQVARTFHLADFFLHVDGSGDQLQNSVSRLVKILFGDPFGI